MKKSRKWQYGGDHLRYQQEWIEWHDANRQRFHPLILGTHRRKRSVEVRVAGTHPALVINIREFDLMVNVMIRGEWFDCILWPDMYPEPVPGGYICPECVNNPENVDKPPVAFKSIAAMRENHLQVLPAVLRLSPNLKKRYGKPVYGTPAMPSLNFKNWQWLVQGKDGILDPYALLDPRIAVDGLDPVVLKDPSPKPRFVAHGGAAMAAYARLQQTGIADNERESLINQLYRYCELDTLAMAMAYESIINS